MFIHVLIFFALYVWNGGQVIQTMYLGKILVLLVEGSLNGKYLHLYYL